METVWAEAAKQLPALAIFAVVMWKLIHMFLSHQQKQAEAARAERERFMENMKLIGQECHTFQQRLLERNEEQLRRNGEALDRNSQALGEVTEALRQLE